MSGTAGQAAHRPADVPDLLRAMLLSDPTRPRLTWYGPGDERVELSAKVLDNWVAKTANLLVEEVDAGPGSRIGIDLPAHWRAAVWLLATWSTGACVVLPDIREPEDPPPGDRTEGEDPTGLDAWVSDRPDSPAARSAAADGALLLAVALPALATSFGPGLPGGALDAAAEGRGRGDIFLPPVRAVPSDPALVRPGRDTLTHADLMPAAAAAAGRMGLEPGARVLTDAPAYHAVSGLLAAWWSGGSVVLHHDTFQLDADQRARLIEAERVTATFVRGQLL